MIKRLLIANRGEIALRIIRACAIRPGQARSQPTFAGHVWRVSNPDGPLYLVRAATKPGRVVIEE